MYTAFSEMLGRNFHPSDFTEGRYDVLVSYFSWHCHVADAISEAVTSHLRESGQPMPDVSDPAVIVRTLYDFFGGKIGEGDGLELVLIPEGKKSDHPDITPGKKYAVNHIYLQNACAIMLGVPTYLAKDKDGKIYNFLFVKEYFFKDIEGMERWLPVRASRKAAA